MVIVTHESYDSVLVGTGKQKGLESLSENREWRRRCDVKRQVVPDGGTRNRRTYIQKRLAVLYTRHLIVGGAAQKKISVLYEPRKLYKITLRRFTLFRRYGNSSTLKWLKTTQTIKGMLQQMYFDCWNWSPEVLFILWGCYQVTEELRCSK